MDWDSFLEHQNWGSLPEWLGAVGTIGAVGLALWSNVSGREQLRRERLAAARERAESALDRKRLREQLERDRVATRRAAATKVSMTLFSEPRANVHGQQLTRVQISVRNGSGEPIKLVNVVARQLADEAQIAPTDPATIILKSFRIVEGLSTELAIHEHPLGTYWRFEVQFSDSDDVRWVRDEFGTLEELDMASKRAVPFGLY